MLRYFASGYRDFSTNVDQYSRRLNWEFMIITEGQCGPIFDTESGKPLLRGPSLWCMPRQLPYRWQSKGQCFRSVFHFAYVPDILREQVQKTGYICKPLSHTQCETVRQVADSLLPLYYSPTEIFLLYSNRALMELSIIALSDVPFAVQPRLNNPDRRRVLQAESWFREHLRRRPKMEEVAARVGVSVSQLRRSFQRVYGSPPHEMFKKMRLHEAMRLLSDTDMTLEQIAANSGFSSVVDFHRCFKAETTVTPDTWRKQILDENSTIAPVSGSGHVPIPIGRNKMHQQSFSRNAFVSDHLLIEGQGAEVAAGDEESEALL